MDSFLLQAVIYLSAAVICVPIAKRLGLSSVLGYIIAGMVIGPYVLGWIGQKGEDVMHFAEFGVVMMLFIIGLELDPQKFWRLRRYIVGMGAIQVVATVLILMLLIHFIIDWDWNTSLSIALALSLSSTAIVLQILNERNLMNTTAGRSSFAVLLFQDIAVIPILAMLPFLALGPIEDNSDHVSLISNLAPWLQVLIVIGSIAAIALAGKFVISPLLRWIAKARLQELFTASALLLVVGVAYLMLLVGLSPALGAFLSGVVLANSEFRHELEGDLAPFKGLLLGLFFIGVGASVNFPLLAENPVFIAVFVFALMAVKFFVLYIIGRIYNKSIDQNLIFAFIMSQAGEFGFVILSFAGQLKINSAEITAQMMAVIAISMFLTPFLFLFNNMFLLPRIGTKVSVEDETIPEDLEQQEVIIAGFGHFGSTVARLLHANNIGMTILDHDSERVDLLRKMGYKVFYGDASRLELLKAAGADKAKLFIACVHEPELNLKMAELVKKNFPHMQIMVRAKNRHDAYEFLDKGIPEYYRETMFTAVHMGVDALVKLGMRRYTATRLGHKFIKYDRETTINLAKKRHDQKAYFDTLQNEIDLQEELLKSDLYVFKSYDKFE